MAEETGNVYIIYVYDDASTPIGMLYGITNDSETVWTAYWYEKNLQGDIVAVYDEAGTKLISYTYDAWGNFTTTYHNGANASSIAAKNPFKYRGYYYDADLELYSVGVRYYDSITGRWISPDGSLYHNLLGYNMFIYCNNTPVNYYDPTGEFGLSILLGVSLTSLAVAFVKAVAVAVAVVVTVEVASDMGEKLSETLDIVSGTIDYLSEEDETTPTDSNSEPTDKKPSRPGKMQEEVKKGQAPKEVKNVHDAHNTKTGKPHVHFDDGTAMNNDGTLHDSHNGTPKLTKRIKLWLGKHNWPTEIKIFD